MCRPEPFRPIRHYLKTLGEPALLTPAGREEPFRTRKALGLLVYLAVEPRPHVREALAELLWSRAAPAEAKHSLANAISEIRRRLGKTAVETQNERVKLRADLLNLDLTRLLSGDVLGNEVDGPLEVDGFLEGFELPDALGFAHWKEARRGGLVPPTRDALVKLIDRARRTGNFPELGRLGERLARFDELSEDAIRARMESRAFAGDRLGALRLYEQWKTELASQMGAVPGELLEGMSMRLRRRGWERAGAVDVPAVRTDHWRDRPFVGRADVYRELYDAWEAARSGERMHRLILGDSGVGKTTLVERITSVAALEGATVVRSQCHELEHELPYGAITELIVQLIERPGASATPPEQLAELAQHIPSLHKRFPSLPAALATQGEASRVRFSEATSSLMTAVAEEHPLIVVLDDVHNCDDVSLAVLHYVLRHSGSLPLQLLFLARPGELRRSQNARRLLEQGGSIGIATVRLPPLSEYDTTALLDLLLITDRETLGIVERRAIVGASGGVPLVLELLLREWRQSGGCSLALTLDAITPSPDRGAAEAATDTYYLVLERLFAALDGETSLVLHTAAILGRHLNEPEMYALADLTASQMMHGLGRLSDLRILRDAGTGLEFANDVVRARAYIAVPASLRRLLHGRVADRLIERLKSGERDHGLDIAWHCARSGRTEEAMTHLLQGAHGAIRRGASHEAEFRLTSALDLFRGAQRTEAVLSLTRLIQEQGRWRNSLNVLAADEPAFQSALGRIYFAVAQLHLNQLLPSELAETIAFLRRVASERDVDLPLAVAVVELAAAIPSQTHDDTLLPELLAIVQQAERWCWPPEEQPTLAVSRMKLMFGLGMTHDERRAALAEVARLVEHTNAKVIPSRTSCSLISGVGLLAAALGDMENSIAPVQAALDLAQQLDNGLVVTSYYVALAIRQGWIGNYHKQKELANAVLAGPYSASASLYTSLAATYELVIATIMLGERSGARELIDQMSRRIPTTAPLSLSQSWMLHRADLESLLGHEDVASALSSQALDVSDGRLLAWRSTAGAAARAVCRVMRTYPTLQVPRDAATLRWLFSLRGRLEMTEATEVCAAYLSVAGDPDEREHAVEFLQQALNRLPRAAARRLEALGTPAPAHSWHGGN